MKNTSSFVHRPRWTGAAIWGSRMIPCIPSVALSSVEFTRNESCMIVLLFKGECAIVAATSKYVYHSPGAHPIKGVFPRCAAPQVFSTVCQKHMAELRKRNQAKLLKEVGACGGQSNVGRIQKRDNRELKNFGLLLVMVFFHKLWSVRDQLEGHSLCSN